MRPRTATAGPLRTFHAWNSARQSGFRPFSAASTARVTLAYELHDPPETANSPPILFLHGFLGSKRENRQISRLLARDLRRRVYALDLRNHGDSGHHPEHNYIELALDVDSFIKDYQLESPTVIGHSMGAKTALTLALTSPGRVASVVAIDNGPIQLPLVPSFRGYLEAMAMIQDRRVKSHREAEKILQNFESSSSIRLWLLSNFVRDSGSNQLQLRLPLDYLKQAIGPLGDFPHKDKPAEFHGPTLFVRALRSHYIPATAFPTMSKLFTSSTVTDIDCGHWVVQERPWELRQAIVNFLSVPQGIV